MTREKIYIFPGAFRSIAFAFFRNGPNICAYYRRPRSLSVDAGDNGSACSRNHHSHCRVATVVVSLASPFHLLPFALLGIIYAVSLLVILRSHELSILLSPLPLLLVLSAVPLYHKCRNSDRARKVLHLPAISSRAASAAVATAHCLAAPRV